MSPASWSTTGTSGATQRTCRVEEWYVDADAAMAHVACRAVTEKLPRLLQVCDFPALWIHFEDTAPKEALAGFGAAIWSLLGGHAR